jgi:predicted ATPase/class 3 adenylate cyclase
MPRLLPSGTVTFLFTDIEGSTNLLRELGAERYRDVLSAHRRVLRDAFARHGGVEVDTQGDAFFVAFPTAGGALAAAAEGQRGLGDLPVRVRIGIHSGEPLVTDEGYVGLEVHRAARIAAVGHGGQTLVSASTRALAADADLRSLGEHRLKDLTRPEPIYQLGEGDFPPLRSLNATHLPVATSALIGRRREIGELTELLSDSVRAVTLTGPGGSGKTRLALQVGAELSERFPGGVFFVPLAAVADPQLVGQALESATGAHGLDDLARWQALLVIDNFEHVLDAAPAVGRMLSAASQVRVLVTSRAPLRIDGEREYPLDPLPDDDAVTLLVERARAVRPGFDPDEAVVEICRRLDGLPLALELAAPRLRGLGTRALLERLDRRLPFLTGGRRDAPARQQTLRATIEWSHDLLAADQRAAFRRLAVFSGTFSTASAQAVDLDLIELDALVEVSLLKPIGGDRFLMLETIREFAREQLTIAGEEEELLRRHAEHFLEVAEQLGLSTEAIEAGRYSSYEAARAELSNLRAALDWAVDNDPVLGIRLAVELELAWTQIPAEGRRRFELLLSRCDDLPARLQARALRGIAGVTQLTGDGDLAAGYYERSLAIHERLGDEWGIVHLQHRIATTAIERGDLARARELLEDNVRRARAGEWRMLESDAVGALSGVAYYEGDFEQAFELARRCLEAVRAIGVEWTVAITLTNLGELEVKLGDLNEAERHLTEAFELAARMEDRQNLIFVIATLALAARARGDDERAGWLWGAIEAESARAPIGRWDTVFRDDYERQVRAGAGPAFERGLEAGRTTSMESVAASVSPR